MTHVVADPRIQLREVSRRYGEHWAVRDLSLELREGELFAFLGPNGAGKTTTIKMLCGLLRPTSGSITVCGHDLATDGLAARANLSYVPDLPFLYEHLTGLEFLELVAQLHGMPEEKTRERIATVTKQFELDKFRDQITLRYSHGMRQKLIVSSAFVHRPDVIVVDEPHVGLDPKSIKILRDVFKEYVRRGHTIMMSTHTLETAESLCDRIAIIVGGKIAAHGTIDELRTSSKAGDLEEIFLKLTGDNAARDLVEVLDA